MEFGGPGLASLSMDERATLANMATECSARAGMVEADQKTLDWIGARRPEADLEELGRVSSLVEAASIDASEEDVEFKISALFNAGT